MELAATVFLITVIMLCTLFIASICTVILERIINFVGKQYGPVAELGTVALIISAAIAGIVVLIISGGILK